MGNIFVIDLEMKKTLKYQHNSDDDELHAICGAVMLGNDHSRDQVLAFGFIRGSWKEKGFEQLQDMPCYLMEMIGKWYCNETIYFMDIDRNINLEKHQIKVDQIINNAKDIGE